MELDASLSLRDEGLSAYHQRHVRQGALGVFLRAVEDGRVPAGSVLIVEGLDRLSRAEPLQAQAQLAQIVNAGITVVTTSDGREYNRERLKAQPMDLVYSLLVMIRAHEESDTKSKRVKAAIRRQCQGWIAGTWRAPIRVGKDPHWVRGTDAGGFQLADDRAAAVRLVIEMFKQGHGAVRIVRELADRELKITDRGRSASSHIYRLLANRMLLGEKSVEVDGETFRLEGYYPALRLPRAVGQPERRARAWLGYEPVGMGCRIQTSGRYVGMTKKQSKQVSPTADTQIAAAISSTISAVSFQGLSIVTPDGNPATLAVIDENGKIVEAGPSVMRAVWDVAIRSYRNFLIGNGHLRVLTQPPNTRIK
ncbi:recombinase family protein [Burkholderia cenocepacia]|uniref:recombinase family protein n=1 Tax=Burkholderia cenocepacia TaxID=95486 RepID=UPI0039EFD35E